MTVVNVSEEVAILVQDVDTTVIVYGQDPTLTIRGNAVRIEGCLTSGRRPHKSKAEFAK